AHEHIAANPPNVGGQGLGRQSLEIAS
ncbi:MAG: hypothetical protein JWQ95_3185, partial [Sphaerisporangium sp.]|nr:hypothetical protein [Sphaerisporangium sp.]